MDMGDSTPNETKFPNTAKTEIHTQMRTNLLCVPHLLSITIAPPDQKMAHNRHCIYNTSTVWVTTPINMRVELQHVK